MKVANDNLKDVLIVPTREVWKLRLGRDLSFDEAKQIVASVTGFFAILAEWSRADRPDPANDNADGATSHDGPTLVEVATLKRPKRRRSRAGANAVATGGGDALSA